MPKHELTTAWTKIASAGQGVIVNNIGRVPFELRKAGGFGCAQVPVDGTSSYSDLAQDLYARSAESGAEALTTLAQHR